MSWANAFITPHHNGHLKNIAKQRIDRHVARVDADAELRPVWRVYGTVMVSGNIAFKAVCNGAVIARVGGKDDRVGDTITYPVINS